MSYTGKSALIVLDAQKAIVEQGDFEDRIGRIESLIERFRQSGDEVIFFKHTNMDAPENPLFYAKTDNIAITLDTEGCSVYSKSKPNAFSNAEFCAHIKKAGIGQLVIVGFNIEYCCMFTELLNKVILLYLVIARSLRRRNPVKKHGNTWVLDCFAPLAMTERRT